MSTNSTDSAELRSEKPTRRWLRTLLGVAVFGLVAALALRSIDFPRFVAGLRDLGVEHFSVVFAVASVHVLGRALRYHWLVRAAGANADYRLRDGLRIFFAGLSASIVTPAKAGDVIKARLVKPFGLSTSTGLGLVLIERVLDLLTIAGFIVVSGLLLEQSSTTKAWLGGSFVFAGLLVGGVLVLSLRPLRGRAVAWVLSTARRLLGARPFLDAIDTRVGELFSAWDLVFASPLRVLSVLTGSALAWAFDFAKLWLVLQFLGAPVPWVAVSFVYPISLVAGIVSMLPFSEGVVGVTAVALLGALTQVDPTVATLAFTLDRSAAVLVPLLLWGALSHRR